MLAEEQPTVLTEDDLTAELPCPTCVTAGSCEDANCDWVWPSAIGEWQAPLRLTVCNAGAQEEEEAKLGPTATPKATGYAPP